MQLKAKVTKNNKDGRKNGAAKFILELLNKNRIRLDYIFLGVFGLYITWVPFYVFFFLYVCIHFAPQNIKI